MKIQYNLLNGNHCQNCQLNTKSKFYLSSPAVSTTRFFSKTKMKNILLTLPYLQSSAPLQKRSILSPAMASALRLLPLLNPRPFHPLPSRQKSPAASAIPRCSSTSNPNGNPNPDPAENDSFPEPPSTAATTSFEVEKRMKSAILRKGRRAAQIERPEPPNFEIGWKRTKEIKTEKPKGWMIADFLEKLEGLIGRRQYGTAELLAKVGEIVAERAREEAEVLVAGGEVEERLVTELYRVLKLVEMDLEMVKAAIKEDTLAQRLDQAQARCRQAILVALSF